MRVFAIIGYQNKNDPNIGIKINSLLEKKNNMCASAVSICWINRPAAVCNVYVNYKRSPEGSPFSDFTLMILFSCKHR